MTDALIGYTGFVGSTLQRQRSFDDLYRSTNISEIRGKTYDTVVCAGAPAQKWIANKEPEADREKLGGLMKNLEEVKCSRMVLVSTVDVFKSPLDVDEDSPVSEEGLHPYGLHRRELEKFVEERFTNHLILRLPGLVGPGLRKNVIFDLLNDNNLHMVDHRGVFQFYPMVNLWYDIQTALKAELRLLHLTAAPVSVSSVAKDGFGIDFDNELDKPAARYDFRSKHAEGFGGSGHYQYSKRDTLQAVRSYAQAEPRKES